MNEELGDESRHIIRDAFMGNNDTGIQTDGFKWDIKIEQVRGEEEPIIQADDLFNQEVEETWLEYKEEDEPVSLDLVSLLIWTPLLLLAATHGLSPSTLLVGILFVYLRYRP